MKACMKTKGKFSPICEEKFHSPAKGLNIKRNTRWPKQKTVSTWAYVPLESSLYHACTTALACFLWWINHSESVWTLCWVFERSLNFFSSVDVEKEVIFNTFYINNKQKQRKFTTNGGQRNWELNCLDLTQSPLTRYWHRSLVWRNHVTLVQRNIFSVCITHIFSIKPLCWSLKTQLDQQHGG